jgi:RTX calcium-binding nonapeptide repeat (4 copies)
MSARPATRRGAKALVLLSVIAAAVGLVAPAATHATAIAVFTLHQPTPCKAGSCRVVLAYDTSALSAPVRLEIIWDAGIKTDDTPDAVFQCDPGAPCTSTSPVYRTAGQTGVVLRVFDLGDGTDDYGSKVVLVAGRDGTAPSRPGVDPAAALCEPRQPNVSCGPGRGRKTPGGGDKVPHKGWPSVTGILWKVLDSTGRKKAGGPDNDELLGHHGSDRLSGGAGHDILWGDWDPANNNGRQRDVLDGGPGNDWLYPSHGRGVVKGGPGRDYVWAYYGRGTIDCGPGANDTARVRLKTGWKVRNCERIVHFCGHGSDGHGGCLKPGEKRKGRAAALPPVASARASRSARPGH